jgi:hypothetical protein
LLILDPVVVANFVARLLVATVLGLALAPIVRAWLAWETAEASRRADQAQPRDSSMRVAT